MNAKVSGGASLRGTVYISGAKNAAIPLICASLLAKGKVLLRNVPRITDVLDLCNILKAIDCRVVFKGHTMLIDNTKLKYKPLLFEECSKLRGSYYLIGVFLALFGRCEISMPGGCKIGSRPIDIHLKAFEDLGYAHKIDGDILYVYKQNALEKASITLKNKSVGASLNALFSALCIEDVTLNNTLFEPEGLDVIEFLNKIGYKINLNNDTLRYYKDNIEYKLIKHTIIPDRIETMTYAVAGLLAGDVRIKNCRTDHLKNPLDKLIAAGFSVTYSNNEIRTRKSTGNELNIKTGIYPDFPTDLQAIFGVLGTRCNVFRVEETIFENRMHIYNDLKNSHVKCEIDNNKAVVYKSNVVSDDYKCQDLRHGMAVILLAMLGEKESFISNFEYVLRGYDDLTRKFKELGFNIEMILEKSA